MNRNEAKKKSKHKKKRRGVLDRIKAYMHPFMGIHGYNYDNDSDDDSDGDGGGDG